MSKAATFRNTVVAILAERRRAGLAEPAATWSLCPACQTQAEARAEKVASANPEWSAEQWTAWWHEEGRRQTAKMQQHCGPLARGLLGVVDFKVLAA